VNKPKTRRNKLEVVFKDKQTLEIFRLFALNEIAYTYLERAIRKKYSIDAIKSWLLKYQYDKVKYIDLDKVNFKDIIYYNKGINNDNFTERHTTS
jgi:hypothetical protein